MPLSQPWWRTSPLTVPQTELLAAVLAAHAASAARDNISSMALRYVWAGSGSFTNAIAGALLTLGGRHAPLGETVQLLADAHPERAASLTVEDGGFVPGWGNSFHKGVPDPLWTGVDDVLRAHFKSLAARLDTVTSMLHARGRKLYPNPSAYTAAAAIALDLPAEAAAWLFIAGRLEAWAETLIPKGTI